MKIELDKKSNDKLYMDLYKKLKTLIETEKLKKRMPSIRNMAKELKVSNSTIIKAYNELEKNGYIYFKEGSGSYVKYNDEKNFYPEDYMENETYRYGYFLSEDKIDFSTASPNFQFTSIEELKKIINFILERDGGAALLYEDPKGYLKLRETLKKNLEKENIFVNLDDIQITSGSQEGIDMFSKVLINSGDVVVVETPTYKGAINSFKKRGAKIEKIPMTRSGIDIRALEKILKTTKIKLLYTTPSYHNPTGITMTEKKKLEVLELAKKYGFYIMEDDCNSDINFSKSKINSIKSYDKDNLVLYIKSYSKVFIPGFRLGFVLSPRKISKSILMEKYSNNTSVPSLNQRIFDYFLETGIWKDYLLAYQETFYKKQKFMYKKLKEINEIKFIKPMGGLWFWLELPKEISGEAVYRKLSKKNVSVLPGVVFSEEADNFIRVSFAKCSFEEISYGIDILKEIIIELGEIK